MKTENELLEVAKSYVKSLSNQRYSFRIHKLIPFKEGILISYQSQEYLDTGSRRELVIGLVPFIIDRKNGEIFHDENSFLDTPELIELFKTKQGY